MDTYRKSFDECIRTSQESIKQSDNLLTKCEFYEVNEKINAYNNKINDIFQNAYIKWFNQKRYEHIPDIEEFINRPPNKDDEEEYYNFWQEFRKENYKYINYKIYF